jgi:hypothetical protein
MRCSNGAAGAYHFKRLSLAKGYGAGSYGQGSMSFTYGLTADESEPYLELPPGKKLKHNGKKLELVDISPAQAAALEVMLNAVTLEVIAIIKQDKDFDYDMEKTPAGWKVYDVKIGGVSLVTTYRETFADQVHDGGVDGLIKSLSDKNRRGDSNLQSFKR